MIQNFPARILKKIIILLMIVVFSFCSAVQAEKTTLLVSGQMDWKPFLMQNNAGEPYGLMYQILEHAARKNGYKLQYRDYPWKRAVVSLEKGKIDIICGIFWNKNRAARMLFSPPVLRNELHIFTRKPFKMERLIDLQGKQGDYIRGGSYGEYFDSFIKSGKAKFNAVTDDQTAINRLVRGYSDFFIGTYIDTTRKINEQGLNDKIQVLPYVVDTVNVYFAYPKYSKKRHYYKQLNNTLAEMQANGKIAEMIKTYFHETRIDPQKNHFQAHGTARALVPVLKLTAA